MPLEILKLAFCLIFLSTPIYSFANSKDRTSTDIYCETMTLALYESLLNYQPPRTPELAKRVEKSQSETLKACKALPTVGAEEKRIKDMTPQEITLIGCIGMAEGIFVAQADSESNNFSYVELTKNRRFIAEACIMNQKRFLGDLRKNGPKYVLKQRYRQ